MKEGSFAGVAAVAHSSFPVLCSENVPSRGRALGFKRDLMSKRLQAFDVVACRALRIEAIEEVWPQLCVRGAILEHLVNHDEYRVPNGHKRSLLASAGGQAAKLGLEIGVLRSR